MGILLFFVIFLLIAFKEKMKEKGEKFSGFFCLVFSIENKKREGKKEEKRKRTWSENENLPAAKRSSAMT